MATNRIRLIALVFCAAFLAAFTATSSWASIVWDLNPTNANGSAGSNTQVFTSGGFQITARGYDNNGGFGTAHDLFFKNIPPLNGGGGKWLGGEKTLGKEIETGGPGAGREFF